jgi:hypothetical protein
MLFRPVMPRQPELEAFGPGGDPIRLAERDEGAVAPRRIGLRKVGSVVPAAALGPGECRRGDELRRRQHVLEAGRGVARLELRHRGERPTEAGRIADHADIGRHDGAGSATTARSATPSRSARPPASSAPAA